jgi:pyridoxal 5'-phosphate synthase pdxT subunit
MRVGVLALQGDYQAHVRAFKDAGAEPFEARTASDLERAEALVLPGGESSTILKLLSLENLFEPLQQAALCKPVFATCAGAILMAKQVTNPVQTSLGAVDIDVERNAYGPQVHSAVARLAFQGGELEAVFIRAPIIRRAGRGVETLASFQGDPVLVRQGRSLVATFHPELSSDRRLQRLFLEMAAS